jgi:hypothetical protein
VVKQQYYCECLSANGLACGAGTAIACWALEIYRDELHHISMQNDRNFSLVSVLMVQQTSAENTKLWRNEIIKQTKHCDSSLSQISPHDWISDNCVYHECVGFINHDTRELSVWDFGSWLRLQSDTNTTGALISVRIAPRFATDDPIRQGRVVWDGIELELAKWIDVPSQAKPLSNHAQGSLIGDVYSHKPKTTTEHASSEPLVVYISGVEMGYDFMLLDLITFFNSLDSVVIMNNIIQSRSQLYCQYQSLCWNRCGKGNQSKVSQCKFNSFG